MGGGLKTEADSLKYKYLPAKCVHGCRQPPNSLFVRCFMVKIPRIYKQCPTPQAPAHTQLGRFPTPWATGKPTPKATVMHFYSLITPLPAPPTPHHLSKVKFSLDTTMLQRKMEDHQLSVIFSTKPQTH